MMHVNLVENILNVMDYHLHLFIRKKKIKNFENKEFYLFLLCNSKSDKATSSIKRRKYSSGLSCGENNFKAFS